MYKRDVIFLILKYNYNDKQIYKLFVMEFMKTYYRMVLLFAGIMYIE